MTSPFQPDGWFRVAISLLTAGVGAVWIVHELVLMNRLRGADTKDPLVRDKWFGYVIGIAIGVIGIVGTLRYNGVL
ncbi:MAG: hypothetical protein H7138_14505 [Myxococcales bacterium]|nr:hypothetical protein [Myxococcales bacterium]